MIIYTLEQFTADTRHLYASDATLKSIHDACNQQEIYDACESGYTAVCFNREETFLTQTPDIIVQSYQLQDGQSLYAILKSEVIHSIVVTDGDPAPHSQNVIGDLAKSDAIEKIKSTLVSQVRLNHDAHTSTVRQQAEESAHETLVLELIERGVL
jgi:hypothetical protein